MGIARENLATFHLLHYQTQNPGIEVEIKFVTGQIIQLQSFYLQIDQLSPHQRTPPVEEGPDFEEGIAVVALDQGFEHWRGAESFAIAEIRSRHRQVHGSYFIVIVDIGLSLEVRRRRGSAPGRNDHVDIILVDLVVLAGIPGYQLSPARG